MNALLREKYAAVAKGFKEVILRNEVDTIIPISPERLANILFYTINNLLENKLQEYEDNGEYETDEFGDINYNRQ